MRYTTTDGPKKPLNAIQEGSLGDKMGIAAIGSMSFDCPYLFCSKCKSNHAPYEDILNLRPGKYQYDVQKVAALFSSKDTYEESADMLNEIYRFGISPDTVHHLANEVASRMEFVENIPSPALTSMQNSMMLLGCMKRLIKKSSSRAASPRKESSDVHNQRFPLCPEPTEIRGVWQNGFANFAPMYGGGKLPMN